MTGMNWNQVKAKLEAEGLLTNGVGRRVQARACRHCHAPTLTGYDGDVVARVVEVDPHPLDVVGEALAVLTGRYTVGLWRTKERFELQSRDRWALAGSPPPDPRFDVLAQHVCGAPALPTTGSAHAQATTRAPAGATPPF